MLSFPAPSITMKDRTALLQNAARRKTLLHISLHRLSLLPFIHLPSAVCALSNVYIQYAVCKCVDPMGKVPRSALIQN